MLAIFLTETGAPAERYHTYRDDARSRVVMGDALIDAYGDLFHVNANPSDKDREAMKSKFKSVHNATDRVAEAQASTFYALLKLADLPGARAGKSGLPPSPPKMLPGRILTISYPLSIGFGSAWMT